MTEVIKETSIIPPRPPLITSPAMAYPLSLFKNRLCKLIINEAITRPSLTRPNRPPVAAQPELAN